MKVTVDKDKCCGAGTCVLVAPDVFDQRDDDGVVVLLDDAAGRAARVGARSREHVPGAGDHARRAGVNTPAGVLVVGASAAGLSTAEALRRKGYQAGSRCWATERTCPTTGRRCPSRSSPAPGSPERAQLRTPEALAALDAEFVLGDPAVALDVATRTVRTASGRVLTADAVVIATGLRARTLPGQDGLAGVHVLRTLDDALALRADLLTCVAAGGRRRRGARRRDRRHRARPWAWRSPWPVRSRRRWPYQVGPAGRRAAGRAAHRARGPAAAGHRGAAGCREDGRVTGVRLETGEVLPADVVVVAIGADPGDRVAAGQRPRARQRRGVRLALPGRRGGLRRR